MNALLRKLSGGDLRSDGRANEVANEVIRNPRMLRWLLGGLDEPDDLVRARAVHAMEGISHTNLELLSEIMPRFISLSASDRVPMVRWHLAMIFGNTAFAVDDIEPVVSALLRLLKDESVFVRSWAISSLCLIGKKDKHRRRRIIGAIKRLRRDSSIAIRVRSVKALRALQNGSEPLPAGWSKV